MMIPGVKFKNVKNLISVPTLNFWGWLGFSKSQGGLKGRRLNFYCKYFSQYQNAFNSKLWAGDCFKFDSSDRGAKVEKYSRSGDAKYFPSSWKYFLQVIMADQLAGYWYRKTAGKKGLIETNKVFLFIHNNMSNKNPSSTKF